VGDKTQNWTVSRLFDNTKNHHDKVGMPYTYLIRFHVVIQYLFHAFHTMSKMNLLEPETSSDDYACTQLIDATRVSFTLSLYKFLF